MYLHLIRGFDMSIFILIQMNSSHVTSLCSTSTSSTMPILPPMSLATFSFIACRGTSYNLTQNTTSNMVILSVWVSPSNYFISTRFLSKDHGPSLCTLCLSMQSSNLTNSKLVVPNSLKDIFFTGRQIFFMVCLKASLLQYLSVDTQTMRHLAPLVFESSYKESLTSNTFCSFF